jgi:multiple sugar transport system substrate-binding protein
MMGKSYKISVLIIAASIIVSVFSACMKGKDNDAQVTGNMAKTSAKTMTTVAKTTVKESTSSSPVSDNMTDSIVTGGTGESKPETNDNIEENDNIANGNTEEAIDESGSDQAIDEKVFDLKGREIRVVYFNIIQIPTLELGTKEGELKYNLMKEAEEKYNCKFKFDLVSTNQNVYFNEFKQAFMAGVYYTDLVRLTRYNALPILGKNGMILPISDYIDFNQPVLQKYDNVNGVIYPDKFYAFFSCEPLTPVGVWYHKEILDRMRIPDIQSIADSGNWNWDTFIDIAINTTCDLNGDGIIDQWGVGSDSASTIIINMMRSNLA